MKVSSTARPASVLRKVRGADDGITVMFDALRDPCRFRVVLMLSETGESRVSDIAEVLAASLPGASRHLRILESAGIVERRRDGREILYRLNRGDSRARSLVRIARDTAFIR